MFASNFCNTMSKGRSTSYYLVIGQGNFSSAPPLLLRPAFHSAAMYHPPCLVSVVVVTVCKVDWHNVWIPWIVMCHCPSECIGVRDLRKCDKKES